MHNGFLLLASQSRGATHLPIHAAHERLERQHSSPREVTVQARKLSVPIRKRGPQFRSSSLSCKDCLRLPLPVARRGGGPARMAVETRATAATPADTVTTSENFQGDVLDPSAFNKNWVRLAAVGAAVAVAARSTGYLPAKGAAFLHLMSFAANFGMIFWVTFVAGLVMFKNMGRQAFGKLQTKLFPKYFAISVVATALQIGTLKFALPIGLQQEQLTSLGIALVASIANFVVEPLGTKVLFERYALENSSGPKDKEKIKSLKGKFGAFHGLSSLLNLVVLVAIAAHGYWLSSNLVFTSV